MTTKLIVSTIAAALIVSAAAYGHGGATGIVKERMDAMGILGDALKSLTSIMQGQVSYDADKIRQNATQIRQHAGEQMTRLFPDGSLGMPSEARALIWSDWEDFEALASRLETLAMGLEAAAENGLMQSGKAPSSAQGGMMGTGMMTDTGMMGSGMMGTGEELDSATLASMPADGVFNMIAQTCSSCHTKFRAEKN